MNKANYGIICDKTVEALRASGQRPRLLLHVCCAPCASAVIEYLEKYFDLTLFFYNPNIATYDEFSYRLKELERFVLERGGEKYEIITPKYDPAEFNAISEGLEDLPEGGSRCSECYSLRLLKSAEYAKDNNFEYFTTTLSVSPYKNPDKLCTLGTAIEKVYGVKYLVSDFKKKNGYLRSIELSNKYSLYRQSYCGCIYSKIASEKRRYAE